MTDSLGNYVFSGLPPSETYVIREVVPGGSKLTAPASGFYSVPITELDDVSGKDFANGPGVAAVGAITGIVFSDTNANAKQDAGEKGLAGVTVYIDANNNGKLDATETHTLTSASGAFTFTNEPAASYRVGEVLPAGYKLIAPTAGYFTVPVTAGGTASGYAFADTPATASISGRVFNDANSDGKRETGELGLGLWTVYIDSNNDGKLDGSEVKAVTDINGNWAFTGLVVGTYVIRVVPVAGTKATTPSGGVLTMKVAAGQASMGNLFGEVGIA